MMKSVNQVSLCIDLILKKVLIVAPLLFIIFGIYGIKHEHGDFNAGSMYPLVFAPLGLFTTGASYILFFVFDRFTIKSKWNILKNVIHLILAIGILWLPEPGIWVLVIITLSTILAVNLATQFIAIK